MRERYCQNCQKPLLAVLAVRPELTTPAPTSDVEGYRARLRQAFGKTISDEFIVESSIDESRPSGSSRGENSPDARSDPRRQNSDQFVEFDPTGYGSGLEVSALVVKGYLPEEARSDPKAIKAPSRE